MVLDDAEIDAGIAGHGEERFHIHPSVRVQEELEFLLVDSGGGQYGGLDAAEEPFRRRGGGFIKLSGG